MSFTALNQPVSAQAQGAWDGTEFSATATLGSISQFLTGQPTGAFPVDVSASAGPNGFSMKGAGDPAQLRGLNLAVSAATPDLAALSSLLGRPLPRRTNVTFSGQVADAGTLAQGIALTNASFSSDQGDLRGDLSLMAGQPPTIKGTLTSNRLDLDRLQAAEPAPLAAPAPPAIRAIREDSGARPALRTPVPRHAPALRRTANRQRRSASDRGSFDGARRNLAERHGRSGRSTADGCVWTRSKPNCRPAR